MRWFTGTIFIIITLLFSIHSALAHFGMVIPDQPLPAKPDEVKIAFMFSHPMEGQPMQLNMPKEAGVFIGGKRHSLLGKLKEHKQGKYSSWEGAYKINQPGVYYIYMTPQPYWEPVEDCFIIHYTKAAVCAMGMEEGWDAAIGLPMEIEPLTRPFGLYAGNSFSGRVLHKGKPLPNAEVEVEFYNKNQQIKPPTDHHITQLVKTDAQGIFSFSMPWPGWWGFAALHTADRKIKHDGVPKPVEIGGVLWIYVHQR